MDIAEITDKMSHGISVSNEEIVALLTADDKDREIIFEAARDVRDKVFGNKIYLYGFMYFSTYCRNDCSFCYFRNSNDISRYRKTREEILELACTIRDAGINLVDLTMGEDPMMIRNDYLGLIDIVSTIHDGVDLPVMVSPGAVPKDIMFKLGEAGGDILACYQETYNRKLFSERRLDQDFDFRHNQKIWAMEAGMLAEDGMMVGIGETVDDRVDTIRNMISLGADQIRAMTFVPQAGTPMEKDSTVDSVNELLCMAVMRLLKHDALIPATLDVEGIAGMKSRLDAGASVITSIIPPNKELAGVAQSCMDIDDGHRCIDYVVEQLEGMGRRAATQAECKSMFKDRKEKVRSMHVS